MQSLRAHQFTRQGRDADALVEGMLAPALDDHRCQIWQMTDPNSTMP